MARGTKKKQQKGPSEADGTKIICKNRRAQHNFEILERFEAGIALSGSEVKSCRAGHAHLSDAYVIVREGNAQLIGGHIAEYAQASHFNHEPARMRQLLLHAREIHKLAVKTQEKGLTAIPLALYFKGGWVKVEIGIGRGRTHTDKRENVKEREVDREIQRAMRRGRR